MLEEIETDAIKKIKLEDYGVGHVIRKDISHPKIQNIKKKMVNRKRKKIA
jgi:hypothetical protein